MAGRGIQMHNPLSPRIHQLVEQIETTIDREALANLFIELRSLLEQSENVVKPTVKRKKGVWRRHERRKV